MFPYSQTLKTPRAFAASYLVAYLVTASVVRAESSEAPASAAPGVESGRAERAATRARRCGNDPRVSLGLVSLEVCVGADLFFRETFGGNGRTCGSCHPASNNYTIDPEYIATLPDSDPLFIAEQNPELGLLESSEILRDSALILVNADGPENPEQNFVLRSVPHILGLAVSTSPPVGHPLSDRHAIDGTTLPLPAERLGWSGDGAPGEGRLRDFADGAIRQHATRSLERRPGVDFFLPDDQERDAIAAFSRSVGRMNDLDLDEVELADAGAARGQRTFTTGRANECAFRCHTNAGAIADIFDSIEADRQFLGSGNLTLDVGTPLVRLPAVDEAGVGLDGGFGIDPLDSDGDGEADSFGNGGFNVPPLIEAADTGAMFHSNAFETLEDAIRFYTTDDFAFSLVGANGFSNRARGGPMPLTETDVTEVGRFLRVLNTALNLQMALHRIDAALEIACNFGNRKLSVERGLLELAAAELEDARAVLAATQHLHDNEQRLLQYALREIASATRRPSSAQRRSQRIRDVRKLVSRTYTALGAGLNMNIGEGTLMF
jgi:cytochrome c peroxidase